MREILFKAKGEDDGEWVEGYYWTNMVGNHFIRTAMIDGEYRIEDIEIDPETLCQYTGAKDENGNKIFENDIVLCDNDEVVTIEWDDDYRAFEVCGDRYQGDLGEFEEYDLEVIGNMFDNPEMLETIEADYF